MADKATGGGKPLTSSVFYILLALADSARHGLGIAAEVEQRTHGEVQLGPGTLYNAIKKMLAERLIAPGGATTASPTAGAVRSNRKRGDSTGCSTRHARNESSAARDRPDVFRRPSLQTHSVALPAVRPQRVRRGDAGPSSCAGGKGTHRPATVRRLKYMVVRCAGFDTSTAAGIRCIAP